MANKKTKTKKVALSYKDTNSPKILIADDDEATRILLRAAITQWGYQIVEASNGEEAWQILQQPDPPKILIIDWVMPKLDGLSLCKKIEKELNYHPYIIFLTRMSGTENVIEGLEAGADEFLLKPFDMAELRIRIFAGERIIKYRDKLEEKNIELQEYVSKITTLTDEKTKQLIPFGDLAIILQGINNTLDDITKKLDEDTDDNEPGINKIKELQRDLTHTIDIIKSFQSDSRLHALKNKSENEIELIDMSRMQAFFGKDNAAIRDFIKTFINLSSEQIAEIHNAILNKNTKSAKYYFHLLRGASGNSGVMSMYELCSKAEEKIAQEDWATLNEYYLGLLDVIEKLKKLE